MKPCQFAVVALALLASEGCRSDPAVPILERELRLKEDEIYRLRATVEEFQEGGRPCSDRAVDDSRESAPAPAHEPAPSRRRSGARGRSTINGTSGANGATPPVIELPSQPATEVPDSLKTPAGSMELPEVPESIQGPSKSLPDQTRSPEAGESDGPALQGGTGGVSSRPSRMTMAAQSGGAMPFTPSGDSRHVAAIALNRMLTGGISSEDGGGDQGLLVVVEPRDRAGRSVDAPAEVSIAVLDPAILDNDGKAMRIARWDFNAAETAAMFRRSGSSRAIHLTTTWPNEPPTHNKLHLFVRYVTADGRKLETNQPIEVALPGDKTARWTQSDKDRPMEHEAANQLRPRRETPAARVPGPAPETATRSNDVQPRRPIWSPERR